MTLRVTHIEYHPAGSERTALWCRAVAASDPGGDGESRFYVLDGDSAELHPRDADRYREEFLELARPISTRSEQDGVLVVGPELAASLRVLLASVDRPPDVLGALLGRPTDTHGLRVVAASQAEAVAVNHVIASLALEVFDGEAGSGRNLAVLRFAWETIELASSLDVYDRAIRGYLLFSLLRDDDNRRRLLREYEVLEQLESRRFQDALRRYIQRVAPRHRTDRDLLALGGPVNNEVHQDIRDELLALNSKIDNLIERFDPHVFAPRSRLSGGKPSMQGGPSVSAWSWQNPWRLAAPATRHAEGLPQLDTDMQTIYLFLRHSRWLEELLAEEREPGSQRPPGQEERT